MYKTCIFGIVKDLLKSINIIIININKYFSVNAFIRVDVSKLVIQKKYLSNDNTCTFGDLSQIVICTKLKLAQKFPMPKMMALFCGHSSRHVSEHLCQFLAL